MEEESKRVQYLMKYWSHLQLAREYEQLEINWKELKESINKRIGELEEFGASFGLTTDSEIDEYIDNKIRDYQYVLNKMQELDSNEELDRLNRKVYELEKGDE